MELRDAARSVPSGAWRSRVMFRASTWRCVAAGSTAHGNRSLTAQSKGGGGFARAERFIELVLNGAGVRRTIER
jgi:hypothetical protein